MPAAKDLFWAWLAATVLSGLPSTLYALATGGDVSEATRAAGAMLLRGETSLAKLLVAAAAMHSAISLFWATLLWLVLPSRYPLLWAMVASCAIAVLDLRIIAPAFFPEIAALDFWPQFLDHLMWGACLGGVLAYRRRRPEARRR